MASMTLKKKPMTKEGFRKKWADSHSQLELASSDPLRLKYHLQPPMGWLNDPNGLVYKNGVFHMFSPMKPPSPPATARAGGIPVSCAMRTTM